MRKEEGGLETHSGKAATPPMSKTAKRIWRAMGNLHEKEEST